MKTTFGQFASEFLYNFLPKNWNLRAKMWKLFHEK